MKVVNHPNQLVDMKWIVRLMSINDAANKCFSYA